MDIVSRKDYKALTRVDKACSSKRAKSTCGAHRHKNSYRKSASQRKSNNDQNLRNNRRSRRNSRRCRSALPVQDHRRSISQRQGKAGKKNRRSAGHKTCRTESRKHSAFELKMFLEENYDYTQHTNGYEKDIPNEPVSQFQNTKVPENVFALRKPNLKRNNLQADDTTTDVIHCHPAKHQATDNNVPFTRNRNIDLSNADVGKKSIDHEFVKDELINELPAKKKTKNGLFINLYHAVIACFRLRYDRK